MTAIRYPDLVAWSPGRRFHCEAISPFNLPQGHPGRRLSPTQGVWPDAFQEDFEYSLYEGQGDQPRWTLPQAQVSDVSPAALHVSDDGWCVVRTHSSFSTGLVTIRPEGRVGQRVDLLAEVFVNSNYVSDTTAGPFWAGASRSYFVTLDGRRHFCVRTWWGQRLLLDLERARRVDEGRHAGALTALEDAWAHETLTAGALEAQTWRTWAQVDRTTFDGLRAASLIAARLPVDMVEPHLRRLETCELLTWSTGCSEVFDEPHAEGYWTVSCFEPRAMAAMTLRRVGLAPTGRAAFAVSRARGEHEERLDLPERIADRSARATAVRPSMPGRDVVRLLGAPDHVGRDWEYDLDGDEPFTLRVRWSDGAVKRADVVEVGWAGDERDRRFG